MKRVEELALASGGVLSRMERIASNEACLVLSSAGLALLQRECSKAGLPITIKHNPRGRWWVSLVDSTSAECVRALDDEDMGWAKEDMEPLGA